jgi:hypothetical protein
MPRRKTSGYLRGKGGERKNGKQVISSSVNAFNTLGKCNGDCVARRAGNG